MALLVRAEEDEEEFKGLLVAAKDTALAPVRIATSRPAQRVYITTILGVLSAALYLGLAIVAYILFYWSYIPPIGFERPLHLQFDTSPTAPSAPDHSASLARSHPHAIATLSPDIISQQRYDVHVELSMPRTRSNREAGNFMLEATMLAGSSIIDAVKEGLAPGAAEEDNKLAVSRRPASLKYRSPTVEYIWKLTELHWYLLGLRDETENLKVGIFESVEFPKGWRNVPATFRLEVQSLHRLQIYSAKAVFRARFRGLRWMMYNHRIISAIAMISGFWTTEMIVAGLVWALFASQSSPKPTPKKEVDEDGPIKTEDDDESLPQLSDTERTFPTSSKQAPLRYESPGIKQEDEEDAVVLPATITQATEADDEEDEEIDVFHDSGLGTSLESSGSRRDPIRRRRSRPGIGDGEK